MRAQWLLTATSLLTALAGAHSDKHPRDHGTARNEALRQVSDNIRLPSPLTLTQLPEDVRSMVIAHLSPRDLVNAAFVDRNHRQLLARVDHLAQHRRRIQRNNADSEVLKSELLSEEARSIASAGDAWLCALRDAVPRFMSSRRWSHHTDYDDAAHFHWLAKNSLHGLSTVELNRLAVQCIAAQWSGCFDVLERVDGVRIAPEVRTWKASYKIFRAAGLKFLARVKDMERMDHDTNTRRRMRRTGRQYDDDDDDDNNNNTNFLHAQLLKDFRKELASEILLDFDENSLVNALARTILNGKSVAVARALLAAGANPRHTNSIGDTPLHHAASVSSMRSLLADLVHAGADLKAQNKRGETPLAVAAKRGLTENVQLLLELGVGDIRNDVRRVQNEMDDF